MSLETRIPKEINDYREKIVFGLSARQLAAAGLAVSVVGVTAFFLYYLAGIDLKVLEYILILEAMPIVAVGFIRHKGLDFEDCALIWLNHRFGPKRLPNMTDVNFLTSLYPVNSRQGDGSREISQKEKNRRRKARKECLGESRRATGRRNRRRPRPARHKQREEA